MQSKLVRRRGAAMVVAAVAAVAGGCGGDDPGSERADASVPAQATAPAGPSGPTEAEIKAFTCREFEVGLTATDAAYVVSAISRAATVDMHTAGKTVQDICRRAKPQVRPYDRALRELGAGNPE